MSSTLFVRWQTVIVGLIGLLMTLVATFLSGGRPSVSALQNSTNLASATVTSRNWSGYVATAGGFTSITGTWTVPQPSGSNHLAADAAWVGIGGVSSGDLLQSGTEDVVNSNGQVTFSPFYELLPANAQEIPVTVNGGDSITVSITETSTNQWQIAFKDNTSGQTYTTHVSYTSSFSSAEWIEEVPSEGRRILALDNFGSVAFSNGSATEGGSQVTIAESNAQALVMVNRRNQPLATPSDLGSDGASFTVTRSDASSTPNFPVPHHRFGNSSGL